MNKMENTFYVISQDHNFAVSDANDKNPKNVGLREPSTKFNFDV